MSIATGLNTNSRACMASCQGGLYYTNDFDVVKVWYGLSAALQNAGIAGPAAVMGAPTTGAGGFTNGDHLIRYRYKNTKTGYVSNPSPNLTYTVSAGNGILTFGIGIADDIIPSTDPKVDQIVIEATPTGGGTFYQVGTAANTATSVAVGQNDDALIQQFNSDAAYGSEDDLETYSSQVPPLGTIVVPYRGRLWVFGNKSYPLTGVTFTATSTTVTGTGFSLNWAGRIITKTGDTVSYEIASVTNSTTLVLSVAYGGSTSTTTATVVSRFPNRGYYSRLFYPEQFLPTSWARDFIADKSDQVVAAVGRTDGLYVFGRYSAERLIFNSDPSVAAGAVLDDIKGRRGCFNQRCFTDVEGELYAWDRQGMWIVGKTPKHISDPIVSLINTMVDFDESDQFHVGFDPISRNVLFFFVLPGDDSPRYAFVFEIETGRWFVDKWLQGITASNVVPTTDGQVRLMLGDENGYAWYYGAEDTFDGVPANTSAVVSVTGSPSTTVIPVVETLPTVAPTLAGVMVYKPSTGEAKVCASNAANSITVASAFAAAPVVGTSLYLGPIEWEYRSKWAVGPGQENLKDCPYLVLKLFPGNASGTMRAYFYADFSTVPSTFTTYATDTWPKGVIAPTAGQSYIEIELDGGNGDGVLSIPVPISWASTIQFRLTSVIPLGQLRVLDAQLVITKTGVASNVGD